MIIQGQSSHQTRQRPVAPARLAGGVEPPTILVIVARRDALALQGAELLFFPTAIGSEPVTGRNSRDHWQRTMQGHAAANMVPVIASNRIGKEEGEACSLEFYGSSFITDQTGEIVKAASENTQEILIQEFDLSAMALERTGWGLFRDRRPELYHSLLSLDGGS